ALPICSRFPIPGLRVPGYRFPAPDSRLSGPGRRLFQVPGKLTLYPSEGVSRHFVLGEDGEHTVGRDPECEVVLEDPRVSTRHALLRSSRGDWRLRDLESKNGTFVNAIRVTEAALADADWVSLGGLLSRFE